MPLISAMGMVNECTARGSATPMASACGNDFFAPSQSTKRTVMRFMEKKQWMPKMLTAHLGFCPGQDPREPARRRSKA
jgi:hypothetical protein